MRRFLFLAVFLAGCGTESAYGQPAWVTGTDASNDAETSADSAADAMDARADVGKDSRADTTTDTAADAVQDMQARVCEPGKQEACACVGGSLGAQRCADDGMLWEECYCPDAGSDSAIDVVADTAADSVTDSAMDAQMDTGTDSGSAVDSGADAGQEAGPVTCPGGRFVVMDPGSPIDGGIYSPACQRVSNLGRVKDTKTGLTWFRHPFKNCTPYECGGVTYQGAIEHCTKLGMRAPTTDEVYAISSKELDSCAFPCIWSTWAAAQYYCPQGEQMAYGYDGSHFCSKENDWHFALCVKP